MGHPEAIPYSIPSSRVLSAPSPAWLEHIKKQVLSLLNLKPTTVDHFSRPSTVADLLKSFGGSLEQIPSDLRIRLEILHRYSHFLLDEWQASLYAQELFKRLATTGIDLPSAAQQQVLWGTLFSDIGKTGPRQATPYQQALIVRLFAYDNEPVGHLKVTDFIRLKRPAEAEALLSEWRNLVTCSSTMPEDSALTEETTLSQFWHKHAFWTYDIIKDSGLPPAVIEAAASHHLFRNINPAQVTRLSLPAKLVILLDKFDAYLTRSRFSPLAAVAAVRREYEASLFHPAEMAAAEAAEFEHLFTVLTDLAQTIPLVTKKSA